MFMAPMGVPRKPLGCLGNPWVSFIKDSFFYRDIGIDVDVDMAHIDIDLDTAVSINWAPVVHIRQV